MTDLKMTGATGVTFTARPLVRFDVEASPAPEGNLRVAPQHGHLYHANAKALREWRELVAYSAQRAMHRRPAATGAVMVSLGFRLRAPKRRVRFHAKVRPDIDKLARGVLDALTGIVYVDDAQVTDLTASKIYGVAGCSVECWEIL
jgi:Holliday junction resolvase RusA-like endonuclease